MITIITIERLTKENLKELAEKTLDAYLSKKGNIYSSRLLLLNREWLLAECEKHYFKVVEYWEKNQIATAPFTHEGVIRDFYTIQSGTPDQRKHYGYTGGYWEKYRFIDEEWDG